MPSHQQCCFKFKQKKIITKLLKINLKLHLVEGAASEPGIVVEVVVHCAQARVFQKVGDAGWRPGINETAYKKGSQAASYNPIND